MNARDELADLLEVLKNRPQSIVVCYTKCWSCQFGEHESTWHTWADEDDIAHAAETGQPDPSTKRCGCYCQREATPAPFDFDAPLPPLNIRTVRPWDTEQTGTKA